MSKIKIKAIKEFGDLAHALFECPTKNGYWDAIDLGKTFIKKALAQRDKELLKELKKYKCGKHKRLIELIKKGD